MARDADPGPAGSAEHDRVPRSVQSLRARGPDGNTWGIPYFLPFSDYVPLEVSWQWQLNAWPNFLITFLCLGFAVWAGLKRGRTFVEVFHLKADAAVVEVLRRRFGGSPAPAVEGDGQEEGVLGVEAGGPAPSEQGREEEQEDVDEPGRPGSSEA